MDNLDLLIQKFKEAKTELQENENLEKALGTKPISVQPPKITTPAVKAPKPSTIVEEDQKRAKEMAAPTMKKNEDLDKALSAGTKTQMQQHMRSDASRAAAAPAAAPSALGTHLQNFLDEKQNRPATLTHPTNMSRAHELHGQIPGGSFQPSVTPKPASKLTGLDRIRAASSEPLKRSEEKLSFNKSGQWSLDKMMNEDAGSVNMVKQEGTGVVAAPKDLSRVVDAPPATAKPALPKITPQPAERVGLAAKPAAPGVGHVGTLDPTHIRPQSGTQLYGMSPHVGSAAAPATQPSADRNQVVMNPHADINNRQLHNFGVHPDPFNAALAQQQARERVAPAIAPVTKGEDMHDEKGRCLSCHSKACNGSDCKKDETEAKSVKESAAKGFSNKIKGAEKLKLSKGGQWSLEKAHNPDHCSRCKKKPCECIKTDGVLVER